RTAKIDKRLFCRLTERLDLLNVAKRPEDMNIQGYRFHPLQSFVPTRYSIHVNGPWCLTFEFDNGDAFKVDFEQYH
ncbi:MAG TPA: type II toxin-antitoxin system RelE/ParE family toxin, partial [Beijerinckiaceae bacterium]|nr:type II toxin-antitoxin system RelE/ParE family toxin [Beijerinckiaceae bacterium]